MQLQKIVLIRNIYDPRTRKIQLHPLASLYARFHELAHKEQHDTNALVFRVWKRMRYYKVAAYLATLWIELDAHLRARKVMMVLGIWSDEACQEGKNNLISYATLKEYK